jgi:hypothetical protein
MVADNDLEPFGIDDINEMELAPDQGDVNVVLQVDRSAYYDTSNGDWATTQRLEVRHDTDADTIGSTFLADLGEQNMGDPQTLADFLVWGVDTYPADHYLVIVWDHGYGWSGGIGNDLGNGDYLSVPELGSALLVAAAHLGRPFDIVAFDACLMQQVDVLFEVASAADYFIGAQDLEPATGWPYEEMVSALGGAVGAAPREVAAALSSAYMDYYGTQRDTMMSVVDARELRVTLAAALNRLALELGRVVEDPAGMADSSPERAIWESRDRSQAMFITDYIDLGDFARRLEADTRLPAAARAAATGVRSALNLTVFAEAHTVYRPELAGLTVYLPASSVPLRYTETRWANESLWDEFIVAFLSGIPVDAVIPTLTVSSPPEGTTVARWFSGSFSATQPGSGALSLQVRVAGAPWVAFAGGSGNFSATAVLDAGPSLGHRTVGFRAVGPTGAPSPTIERGLTVVADPVTLEPVPSEFVVATGRTSNLTLNATLRDPFTSFTLAWRGLPPGVTNAGPTSFTPAAPGVPLSVPLVLAASGAAGPGAFATAVFSPQGMPTVETLLRLDIVVTEPLPDLALLPLVLDQPLPWPDDVVNVSSEVSNDGFDAIAGARAVATVDFGGANITELLNVSVGGLLPGERVPLAFNWTVQPGTQRVALRVESEPATAERTLANNLREVTVNVTDFALSVVGPPPPVAAASPGNSTDVWVRVENLGTSDDNYTVVANVVDNPSSWTATPPGSVQPVPARTGADIAVSVATPPSPLGGEAFVFDVVVSSQGSPGLQAVARVTVLFPQVHEGHLRASPVDIELPHRGTAAVAVALENTGNGPERFSLLLQNSDPALQVTAPQATFDLGPGALAEFNLTLTDLGLVSAERPYALDVVAVMSSTGLRVSALVSVRVAAASAIALATIERALAVGPEGNGTFHANVTNAGNTYAVVAVSATAADPNLEATLPTGGLLLPPGGNAVVNGTVRFLAPPLAGEYTLALSAADTRGEGNATANLTVTVPVVHLVVATPASAPAHDPTPDTFARVVRVENLGNAPESLLLVIGLVPVGLSITIEPSDPTLPVPAFGNASFTVRIERSPGARADGQIEVLLSSSTGGPPETVVVAYAFADEPQDTTLVWGLVLAGVTAGAAAWVWVTRPRRDQKPPEG